MLNTLDQMIILLLRFRGTAKLFSIAAAQFALSLPLLVKSLVTRFCESAESHPSLTSNKELFLQGEGRKLTTDKTENQGASCPFLPWSFLLS